MKLEKLNIRLDTNEAVVYQSQVHLLYCVPGLIIVLFGINLVIDSNFFSNFQLSSYPSIIIFILGIIIVIRSFIIRQTTKIILTNKRIITSVGFFKKEIQNLEFKDVLQVRIKQNICQRLLNFGMIEIITNRTIYKFRCIKDLQKFINTFREIADLRAQIEYFSNDQEMNTA